MSEEIIDRGRGPEIPGTRVTVYRIMDYLREEASPARIADELRLTPNQVIAQSWSGTNEMTRRPAITGQFPMN